MEMVKALNKGVTENRWLLIYHGLAWAFFITYELSTIYLIRHQLSSFIDYFIHYSLNAAFFYFNAYFIFPQALKLGKLRYYILSLFILAEIIGYTIVACSVNWGLAALNVRTTWNINNISIIVTAGLFRAIYLLSLSIGYWFAIHFYKSIQKNYLLVRSQLVSEKKQAQLEKEIIIAENAYLQAQVSPHLMFNTLNYIYNSIEEISADAAAAVMPFIRYQPLFHEAA